MSTNEILVGASAKKTGSVVARGTFTGETATQDAYPRFQELALAANLYSGGMTLTSISAATFTTATLGATCTPIFGVWNPVNSGKSIVLDKVTVSAIITAATSTGAGALMWASSLGNGALTLGTAPYNRGTGVAAGSVGKDMSGIALTGLTNNLVVRSACEIGSGSSTNFSFVGTAAGAMTPSVPGVANMEGSMIVPPGMVLALLSTSTGVAISAAVEGLWHEVAI